MEALICGATWPTAHCRA